MRKLFRCQCGNLSSYLKTGRHVYIYVRFFIFRKLHYDTEKHGRLRDFCTFTGTVSYSLFLLFLSTEKNNEIRVTLLCEFFRLLLIW